MIRTLMIFSALFLTIFSASNIVAQIEPPIHQTEGFEKRARELGRNLRCVVCQNQSIEDSQAPLALDMRKLVRRRMAQGQSDEQIIEFMRVNYGDFVLLKPPVQPNTFLLWGLPFIVLGFGFYWAIKRQKTKHDTGLPLSPQERSQLDEILKNKAAQNVESE